MTDRPPTDRSLSRRRFLTLAGAGAVAAGGAGWLALGDRTSTSIAVPGSTTSTSPTRLRPGAATDRILVVVQLEGGLDHLNTVVPIESGRYRDLRADGAIDPSETTPIDGEYGLLAMPRLAGRWEAGELAIVHGVGWQDSTLSHFEDTDIWEKGTTEATEGTGWLGRALSATSDRGAPDPLIGVSFGELSPTLRADGWSPVALPEDGNLPWTAEFIEEHPHLVRAFADLNGIGDGTTSLAEQVRASQALVRDVAGRVDDAGGATSIYEQLAEMDELDNADEADDVPVDDDGEPIELGGGELTARLELVARLIRGGLPTRAFHVRHGGDFDTHASQTGSLPLLLGELDAALAAFDVALGEHRDRVVIATWTEFGRRPEWNGDGTEHGTAGVQFVVGPAVSGGHHGEPSSLTRFDRDDNFVVTTDFRDYLGGLTTGALGVPVDHVVDGRRRPLELFA